MIDAVLVPEKTKITNKGDGSPVDISAAATRVFLVTLKITDVVEQESIDVSISSSADGAAWDPKPVAIFPQVFYRGETPLLLDLSGRPEVQFVRAHWEVNRWGRGSETPMFEFELALKEVPEHLLHDAHPEAKSKQ